MLALAPWAHAHAQTSAVIDVSVDATATGPPLERVWPFHGYDEVNYTTAPEGRALLGTLAAAHSAPVHVRTHFLFNTGDGVPAMKWGSTNVYTEDLSGKPVYTWTLTDAVLDTLTASGVFPFVELGFMPEALSLHPTPYRNASITSLDGGCFYPPTDPTKWAALVRAWAAHADARYPAVQANWLWELWNEPDIDYWHGTFDDYAKLYDYTESALHGVLPGAALGGPAVADAKGTFLSQFLRHCAAGTNAVTGKTGTRLDLVTFHAKGGAGFIGGHVQMNLGNQLRLHEAGFRAVAAEPSFRQTPIHITEADPDGCAACPASRIPADAYRNSPAYGAYEVAMMKHTLELGARVGVKLAGLLTWAFTFPDTPYFAGYRALATSGVNLPVLSAFQLLGRLGGTRLPVSSSGSRTLDDLLANGVRADPDIDGMATRDGSAIRILLWNYHDDLVTAEPAAVRLTTRVPASFGPSVRLSHLRVDESHGDAYPVWVAQGMPQSPTEAQIAALRQAMEPSPLTPDGTLAVAEDGSLALEFELPRFGISLLTIGPVDAIGDASPGDGPSRPPGGVSGGGCACRVHGADGGVADDLAGGFAAGVLLFLPIWRRAARRSRLTRPGGASGTPARCISKQRTPLRDN